MRKTGTTRGSLSFWELRNKTQMAFCREFQHISSLSFFLPSPSFLLLSPFFSIVLKFSLFMTLFFSSSSFSLCLWVCTAVVLAIKPILYESKFLHVFYVFFCRFANKYIVFWAYNILRSLYFPNLKGENKCNE